MTTGACALPAARRLDAVDITLFVVYLLGLYLGVSLQITAKIPLTCAPSGLAGMLLLWRRRDDMRPRQLAGLLLVAPPALAPAPSLDPAVAPPALAPAPAAPPRSSSSATPSRPSTASAPPTCRPTSTPGTN